MAQKVSYEAHDKKKGMTLDEINVAVSNAIGLAVANGHTGSDSKVKVLVNFNGGIKELIVEV
jgi:hypothetical protein